MRLLDTALFSIAFVLGARAHALSLDASVSNQCAYQTVDYYKQDMIFIPKAVPIFAASASLPRLISRNPWKGSQCGGTVISDDCKILTDVHCLSLLVDPSSNQPRPVDVNGRYSDLEVIAAGIKNPQKWKSVSAMDLSHDWAVIRVNDGLCGPCLRASARYAKGEDVWSVGYPIETKKYRHNSAGGGGLYFSPGKAYGSFEESPKANELRAFLTHPDPDVRKRFQTMVLASVTATAGDSGGPLLNAKGEVVAVAQSTTTVVEKGVRKNADSPGAMLFTPVSEIQRQLGPEKSAEIFNCKGHRETESPDQFVPTLSL